MARDKNTYAKRQRETLKRQKAEAKRERRQKRKEQPADTANSYRSDHLASEPSAWQSSRRFEASPVVRASAPRDARSQD